MNYYPYLFIPPAEFRAPLAQNKLTSQVLCPPPSQCTACGGAVSADGDKSMRHQFFERPKMEPIATEYVRLRGVCSGCGHKYHGALPAGVPNWQLGSRELTLMGTLAGQYLLTQSKLQYVLLHIMGIRFSLGTVSQAHGLVSQALAALVVQLPAELQHAPVCHSDETRHQSHGHTMWMWVMASDWGVRFRIDPSRAQLAAKLLLGERPSFITVSDRYADYNHLPIEQRQVCWDHLLRDFERIVGRTGLGGRVGKRLLGYGCLLFRWRAVQKPAQHFEWLQKRIRIQLELGSTQTQCCRTANTCANLTKMWPVLRTFPHKPLVKILAVAGVAA